MVSEVVCVLKYYFLGVFHHYFAFSPLNSYYFKIIFVVLRSVQRPLKDGTLCRTPRCGLCIKYFERDIVDTVCHASRENVTTQPNNREFLLHEGKVKRVEWIETLFLLFSVSRHITSMIIRGFWSRERLIMNETGFLLLKHCFYYLNWVHYDFYWYSGGLKWKSRRD